MERDYSQQQHRGDRVMHNSVRCQIAVYRKPLPSCVSTTPSCIKRVHLLKVLLALMKYTLALLQTNIYNIDSSLTYIHQ